MSASDMALVGALVLVGFLGGMAATVMTKVYVDARLRLLSRRFDLLERLVLGRMDESEVDDG